MNSDTFPDLLPDDSNAPWTGALPTPLKRLLTDELRAGNSIQYVAGCGLDPETILLVLLARPFLPRREPLPENVFFRQVNAPDAWPAEYYTEEPSAFSRRMPSSNGLRQKNFRRDGGFQAGIPL